MIVYYNTFQNIVKGMSIMRKIVTFDELIKQGVNDNIINPIIVSKKNKKAIEYRCEQYGLFLPSDTIYGKDELNGYDTKAEFIREYMSNNNINTAYFIDDNSNNLEPCKKYPEIIPLLAGWGNIKIGEIGLTEEEIAEKL